MSTARAAAELPGLTPIPLVGRQLGMLRLLRDPLRILPRLYREHGEIVAVNRGDPSLVCAFGPEHNQQLLPHAREFEHYGDVPVPVPAGSAFERMQSNLTSINGDLHRRQRRLMMPAFTRSAIAGHRDDMVAIAERRLEGWRGGQAVDVGRQMFELTLDVMMKCLFGLDAGKDASELGQMGKDYLQLLITPTTALLPFNLPRLPYGRLLRLCERFEERLLGMVRERRAATHAGRDVLSILIEAHDEDGSRLSDVELLGNMGLLFVAGHETTAYALTWTLVLLALHPKVAGDLRDELQGELRGEAPTVEQLSRLPLLDAVVKESMRLLPPTYIMFIRRATGEFSLGPFRMPADSMVVLSPWVTHHMPRLYAEPRRFRPQRWSEGKRSPFEYLPFGAGPRLCLGATFAEQEIRLVLAILVQRFGLRLVEGSTIDLKARGITLGPAGAVPMVVGSPGDAPRRSADIGGAIREFVRW